MTKFWQTAAEIDRRLCDAGIPYCLIKTYHGDLTYDDGNVDVVIDGNLLDVYRRVFQQDFIVTPRDRFKHRVYETNKLMLNHAPGKLTKLHLHSSCGWHNITFMPASEIVACAETLALDSGKTMILKRDQEARCLVMHIIFEQFSIGHRGRDKAFIQAGDYDLFARDYDIPPSMIAPVRDAPDESQLSYPVLRPIWRRYYRNRVKRGEPRVNPWQRFLHWGLTVVQSWRSFKRK
jgi:hypothetical protein